MSRHVHLVVSVELDDEGKAISAVTDENGGPWAYSDRPQTYDDEAEGDDDDWRPSTDDEAGAADSFLWAAFHTMPRASDPPDIAAGRAAIRKADTEAAALAALPEVEKLRHIVATYEDLARRVTRASQGSVAQLKALHELAGMVAP